LGPFQDTVFWDQVGAIGNSSRTSITVYTLDDKTLNISKTYIERFFNDKELEDGRAK
jgi:hypothetical protein